MKMKALITAALIAIPAIAGAQLLSEYPLMVFSGGGHAANETFAMLPTACLRGPLYFKNTEGKKIFELAAGIDFPTGCTGARP